MLSYRLDNMAITVGKEGANRFAKASYPIRFGKYSEIRTFEYEFHFNLRGEIKFIRGLGGDWPHPSEWLKRTDGNDWVFYSVGAAVEQKGIIDWVGEYYLPCLTYASNSVFEFNPYMDGRISKGFAAWGQLYGSLFQMRREGLPPKIGEFLDLVSDHGENILHERSEKLHDIIGGRVSVLPPDTRHVDYEVIPLMIADGCLYRCNFCCVKSGEGFRVRSEDDVLRQIRELKAFYDVNLENHNALFLGNHDALGAGEERILMAASEAFRAFGFEHARMQKPTLFLFGSVGSLLKAGNALFEKLAKLPFHTYVNIGLESVDPATLASINKPVRISMIREAFQRMLEINREHGNIEITANFLLGEQLPPEHERSLGELLGDIPDAFCGSGKGTIYLSPLISSQRRGQLLPSFFEIKKQSRLPAYVYLIQRL